MDLAMEKSEAETLLATPRTKKSSSGIRSAITWIGLIASLAFLGLASWHKWDVVKQYVPTVSSCDVGQYMDQSVEQSVAIETKHKPKVVRTYNITVGYRWLSLDGGRWRVVFTCNGLSPCPTLTAREGDELDLHLVNDLGAQLSLHWSGMSHKKLGFWNDGTGGLNQFPVLPRANWTSRFDTTGHWGLNWYADHTGAGVADGVYGVIYVAPHPSRPRPYKMITDSPEELALIQEAEDKVRNVALWNLDHRAVDWKIAKLKAKGAVSDLYCYKSLLVNGKGRVHCRNPNYSKIDGEKLDESGCVMQPGHEGHSCQPTDADYQIFESNGEPWMMLNIVNVGFEHALKWSIDDHKVWIVATDAGFIEPQHVDTVYITNGARVSVLVKMDKAPKDYAIRLASASKMQNLEGFAILRYPAVRYPIHGLPMELPQTDKDTRICLNADSSVPSHCTELDHSTVRTYPRKNPPKKSDKTLMWTAGSQPSKYEEHVTEYFVNSKPWQLFRAAMEPVFFTKDPKSVEKPVQNDLPYGSVIDLIVQNTLNETIPMYKHGSPTFQIGKRENDKFTYKSIDDAIKHGVPMNVSAASMQVVHDLPPLGWIALRWKVDLKGATMFHAVKLRYFALGMAAPMLEGFEKSMLPDIPEYALDRPHIQFEPANPGVLG